MLLPHAHIQHTHTHTHHTTHTLSLFWFENQSNKITISTPDQFLIILPAYVDLNL